jgi:hypothetical protein
LTGNPKGRRKTQILKPLFLKWVILVVGIFNFNWCSLADKHYSTRIKPLPLTNGHGRYITATPEWACFCWGMAVPYNRYKYVTVPLLKTVMPQFQKRNGHLNPEVV